MSEPKRKTVEIDVARLERRLGVVGVTGQEASRRAGLGPDAVRDILRGKTRAPRISTLSALADALECDAAYLTGEQDVPRRSDPGVQNSAAFSLDYEEVQLIGLFRAAREHGEHTRILAIARTLVQTAESAEQRDQRGRRIG
jgi:transcriptional regulator with XRE-family HTH domain